MQIIHITAHKFEVYLHRILTHVLQQNKPTSNKSAGQSTYVIGEQVLQVLLVHRHQILSFIEILKFL